MVQVREPRRQGQVRECCTGQGGKPRGHREAGEISCDDGVATVFACVACVVLLALAGLAIQLGAVLVARHRAEVAADLAALAGAAVVLRGESAACGRAAEVSQANGSELSSCQVIGADLRVQVRSGVRAGPLLGWATGRARAGPAAAITG